MSGDPADEVGSGADDGETAAARERRAIERAIGLLGTPGPAAVPPPVDALDHLYTELLGILPLELDERPPAPGLKARLLATVRGDERRAAITLFPRRVPTAGDATPGPRRPRWLVATAAALALTVIGWGLTTAILLRQLDAQGAVLVRLADELEESRRRGELLARAQGSLERRSLSLASQLALVANPGVEVCPLEPTGAEPLHPQARGLLFLSMADQQWYVRVANLEPAPPGRVYRLWFLTAGGGAMPAGELQAGPDDGISLGGRRLPDPAVMSGAAITLERLGEDARRPSGPTVLFGDEKMTIL